MGSKDYFTLAQKGAADAFSRTRSALRVQADPQLALYDKLEEPQFEAIRRIYGTDGLTRYVTTMERKRLVGGSNGKTI